MLGQAPHSQLPNAVPLVIGALTALDGAREAMIRLSRGHLPDDRAARALLRAGVDHAIESLRSVADALLELWRRLG